MLLLPAFAQCDSAKCHVGIEPMHASPAVHLACTDCHGGRADTTDKLAAHVAPRNRALWRTAANPSAHYAALNQESPEFVRFVNPGDLRVADQTCGNRNCHGAIVAKVRTSLMSHGAFLWGAALYNNGAFPLKRPVFGESYARDGVVAETHCRPAALRRRDQAQSAGFPNSGRCRNSKPPSPATRCASSSAATTA